MLPNHMIFRLFAVLGKPATAARRRKRILVPTATRLKMSLTKIRIFSLADKEWMRSRHENYKALNFTSGSHQKNENKIPSIKIRREKKIISFPVISASPAMVSFMTETILLLFGSSREAEKVFFHRLKFYLQDLHSHDLPHFYLYLQMYLRHTYIRLTQLRFTLLPIIHFTMLTIH